MERPKVDVNKVAAYLTKLTVPRNKNFHGSITLKIHAGEIVKVEVNESLNLVYFKREDEALGDTEANI